MPKFTTITSSTLISDAGNILLSDNFLVLVQANMQLIVQNHNLTASVDFYAGAPRNRMLVKNIVMVSDTVSTSTGANNWAFQLHNFDQANDCFATAPDTDVGSEFGADADKVIVPDQNLTILAREVMELQITKSGSATSLVRFSAWIEWEPIGDA